MPSLVTRACNPSGGIKLFWRDWALEFVTASARWARMVLRLFVGFFPYPPEVSAMIRCVNWTGARRRKDSSVNGPSFPKCLRFRNGRRRSCWLARATSVLWWHTKSHEPRWSIGPGLKLYSLSPQTAFLMRF